VYGIEGDFLWTSIKGDDQVNSVNLYGGGTLPVTLFADQEVDWMSTIRGRYGRLCHNYNIYGTGGIAFGGINSFAESDYTQIAGIFFNASDDSSRTGWTIGGGIEGGFEKLHHLSYGGKMTWRVQYLYANFGTTEAVAPGSTPIPPFEIKNTFSNSTNVIQFGLNYRF
jgi:outer membrane immunogenic protein